MKCPGLISKLRHFRGHGIHSPFVYGLKRQVFMKRKMSGENIELYNTLIASGIRMKVAKELQNLHNYCNFSDFEIVNGSNMKPMPGPGVFYIASGNTTIDTVAHILGAADKTAVALLDKELRRSDLEGNIKIERRHYTLIFKDSGMPVQTFKL